MPPAAKSKTKGGAARRSRSRNTTPSSSVGPIMDANASDTAYLELPLSSLMVPANVTYKGLLERYSVDISIPDSKSLNELSESLVLLKELAKQRGEVCDRGMRALVSRRKDRVEEEAQERHRREQEDHRKEKIKRDRAAKDEEGAQEKPAGKLQRISKEKKAREERPLAQGAHGVARQDGMDTDMKDTSLSPDNRKQSKKVESSPSKRKRKDSTSVSSLSPASHIQTPGPDIESKVKSGATSPSDSESEAHQPRPAPAIPQYQTFGADPSTFDDPTIYHVREVTPGMSEDERKEIYAVADYPHDDLHSLTPGTPPDKDFSNGKPTSNQVAAHTFQTYVDPYFRQYTEEDHAFLRARGDRVTPFIIPRRGKRHYQDIWAEEDGAMSIDGEQESDSKLPANQARGDIDQLDDSAAETEKVSAGPVLERLMALMIPENRGSQNEDKPMSNGLTNGDTGSNGIEDINGEAETNGDSGKTEPLPPATFMPDSQQPNWKVPTAKLNYAQMDERLKAELRHIGFLPEDVEPDYDAHEDDDVAARLRLLQAKLEEQMIVNGARKARVLKLVNEQMAHQDYNNVKEDLDNQLQTAFLKRNRTLGKGKKQQKRPGGAGGGSHYVGGSTGHVSRLGIGEQTKMLMDRRRHWIDTLGGIFDERPDRVPGEDETIFPTEEMASLEKQERQAWHDAEE